jgi:hypothetical protein
MTPRKLVKIGEKPELPTIHEFFIEMAERQHEEIRRLKAEVAGQPVTGKLKPHPKDSRKPVPDPWLLHPTRIKRVPAKKKVTKKGSLSRKKGVARTATPKRKIK